MRTDQLVPREPVSPPDLAALVRSWYATAARDLPWRRADTPAWAVLVSEVMLQQTPVARVQPVWTAWLERWPDAHALAAAAPADVLRAWDRLGYPRRALRLLECARAVVDRYDGVVPDDVDALMSLPGVGHYTARAVAVFAFGQRHPVVDINVRRVVARSVEGLAEPGLPSTRRDLEAVSALLPEQDADAAGTSIALMELGALVCTARRPSCPICPLLHVCAWQRAGRPAYTGLRPRPQKFAGTDRQVRGLLMAVLRQSSGPVGRPALDVVWPDVVQVERALGALVADGLAAALPDEHWALPGHGPTG